jgi:hypothetical protein
MAPSLLLSLVIVRFKSSQDILQGVSKLDYLLKVSVFQKYKNEELENKKYSIATVEELSNSDLFKTSILVV